MKHRHKVVVNNTWNSTNAGFFHFISISVFRFTVVQCFAPFCSNTCKIVPSFELYHRLEAPEYVCTVKRLYRKILRKLTGKHLFRSPFLIKLQSYHPSLQQVKKSILLLYLLKVERKRVSWIGWNWLMCYMRET